MPSFETHKLEQLNNEVLNDNEQDVFERETTLPDVSVFSPGKTNPFPERDHVLAAKYPSVSADDKDRLDIVGLPVTNEYKIDEIPGEEIVQVLSKATDGVEKRIKLVRDRIGSIEQEFLRLDEKRSLDLIDPILESLRRKFVAINKKTLLRSLRSNELGEPQKTRTKKEVAMNPEKMRNFATPRMFQNLAILRSLRSTNPTKVKSVSTESLANVLSPHRQQIVEDH